MNHTNKICDPTFYESCKSFLSVTTLLFLHSVLLSNKSCAFLFAQFLFSSTNLHLQLQFVREEQFFPTHFLSNSSHFVCHIVAMSAKYLLPQFISWADFTKELANSTQTNDVDQVEIGSDVDNNFRGQPHQPVSANRCVNKPQSVLVKNSIYIILQDLIIVKIFPRYLLLAWRDVPLVFSQRNLPCSPNHLGFVDKQLMEIFARRWRLSCFLDQDFTSTHCVTKTSSYLYYFKFVNFTLINVLYQW